METQSERLGRKIARLQKAVDAQHKAPDTKGFEGKHETPAAKPAEPALTGNYRTRGMPPAGED